MLDKTFSPPIKLAGAGGVEPLVYRLPYFTTTGLESASRISTYKNAILAVSLQDGWRAGDGYPTALWFPVERLLTNNMNPGNSLIR